MATTLLHIALCSCLVILLGLVLRYKIQNVQLLKSNNELEKLLSLETTVKSLLEVIRHNVSIYTSADIISTTLANLLNAEGMCVYLVADNSKNQLLGEFFQDGVNKQKLKNALNNNLIAEVLKNDDQYLKREIEIDNKHYLAILLPITTDNIVHAIAVLYIENTLQEIDDFTQQVLFYAGQMVALAFDMENKLKVEKLLERQAQYEKMTQDLTKKLEQEVKNNELQNDFISVISHEFRTPLAVIGSATRLVKFNAEQIHKHLESVVQEVSDALHERSTERATEVVEMEKRALAEQSFPTKIAQQLKNINTYITRLSQLIEGTLQLNAIDSNKNTNFLPTKIELLPVVSEIVVNLEPLREDVKINFTHHGNEHFNTFFDSRHLYLIISNIISNAIKYSKGDSEIFVNLHLSENNAILEVEDQGIGIPAENIERLFQKYFRAENAKAIPGTGIGLHVSKRLLDLNRGLIEVQSEVNKGTIFKLTFPKFTAHNINHQPQEVING